MLVDLLSLLFNQCSVSIRPTVDSLWPSGGEWQLLEYMSGSLVFACHRLWDWFWDFNSVQLNCPPSRPSPESIVALNISSKVFYWLCLFCSNFSPSYLICSPVAIMRKKNTSINSKVIRWSNTYISLLKKKKNFQTSFSLLLNACIIEKTVKGLKKTQLPLIKSFIMNVSWEKNKVFFFLIKVVVIF